MPRHFGGQSRGLQGSASCRGNYLNPTSMATSAVSGIADSVAQAEVVCLQEAVNG